MSQSCSFCRDVCRFFVPYWFDLSIQKTCVKIETLACKVRTSTNNLQTMGKTKWVILFCRINCLENNLHSQTKERLIICLDMNVGMLICTEGTINAHCIPKASVTNLELESSIEGSTQVLRVFKSSFFLFG